MDDKWLTTAEAAVVLGVSERTVQRRASNGIYESKTEAGRKYVLLPDDANISTGDDSIVEMQREKIELLQERIYSQENEMERVHGEIDRLHKLLEDSLAEAREARERSDTIILSMSQRLDNQVKMLEDLSQREVPLWHRIKAKFTRSATVENVG